MRASKPDTASKWIDPDDAPEWDEATFARAEIRHGDQILRVLLTRPGCHTGSFRSAPFTTKRTAAALRCRLHCWGVDMKECSLQVRLSQAERDTLRVAAETAGLSVSAWLRDRLRKVARQELQSSGVKVPFLETINGR